MKKNILKLFAAVAVLALTAALVLVGCADTKNDNKLLVIAPDGAPAFAMAQLFSEKPQFDGVEVEYKVVSANEVQNYMTTGAADIAILPTNMGANLYNKGEDVKLVGATTFGIMYIVSRDESVKSFGDLEGKTVVSIGQGNVPEFVLRYLLKRNGIKNVTLEFRAEGTDVVSGLVANTIQIGVLGEPAATGAVGKLKQLEVPVSANVIDLQTEWKAVTGNDGYPQSALFTRSSVVKNHVNVLSSITEKIGNAEQWITENFEEANSAVLDAGGKTKLPAVGIVKKIRVGFLSAKDVKSEMNEYFGIMGGLEPAFIGWKFPDDAFYL